MLFLHNTSRVADEKYPTLLQDKGFRGFPSLCFMDADGNVLAKPGRSVDAFVTMHGQVKDLVVLRAKATRTPAEEKQLFLAELKLGLVAHDAMQARADKLPLDDAEKQLVAEKHTDGDVQALLAKLREAGPEATGEKIAEMAKAGRRPSHDGAGVFWMQVLQHASRKKDAALAQQAHDALVARYESEKSPGIERQRQNWKKMLDEAKAKRAAAVTSLRRTDRAPSGRPTRSRAGTTWRAVPRSRA